MPLVVVVATITVLTGCGSGTSDRARTADASATRARARQIAREIHAWGASESLTEARAHAEAAANLVVGPGGPGYGDRDGDGTVAGAVDEGLLPARSGAPRGLVLDRLGDASCVRADLLGGDWDDPTARWAELVIAIRAWTPTNNTFPELASHPMRIVGWATLAQDASFTDAIEYAGHASIHVDVTRDSLARC